MKNDNRGVSLTELLIVIAIIAVLTSVGLYSINAMTGRPAQQCAQKIIYSLEKHRTTAMGKVDASYTLRVDSTGKIFLDERVSNDGTVAIQTTKLASSRVKLSYETTGGVVEMGNGSSVTLGFDRGSGSFKPIASGDYVTRIIAKSGGREVKVKLVRLTGKVYLDVE